MAYSLLGIFAAFLSALLFGLNSVVARIVGHKYSESVMLPASLLIGTVISVAFPIVSSPSVCPKCAAAYAFSGVANFAVARFFFFKAVRRVGASVASLVISGNVIVTALLSAVLLGETPTSKALVGLLFFLAGVAIANNSDRGKNVDLVGLVSAFLAMFFVSMVNISIRYANLGQASPFTGVFISYMSAILAIAIARSRDTIYAARLLVSTRSPLLVLLGIIPLAAQSFRFVALDYIPAFVAAPIFSTSSFIALLLVYLLPSTEEKIGLSRALGVIIGFWGIGLTLT